MLFSIMVYDYIIHNIFNMCTVCIFNKHVRKKVKMLIWRYDFSSVDSPNKTYNFSDN